MKSKKILLLFLLLFSVAVLAQGTEVKDGVRNDNFVEKAASWGLMEVQLGKLAQEKGNSQDVKNFGEIMIREHSKANDEFKNIAQQNNIMVPAAMLDEHLEHIGELDKLSGSEFDKAYMKMMVEDHKEDVELFREAADSHENEEIRSWAEETLKTLKEHYQLAQEINNKLRTKSIVHSPKSKVQSPMLKVQCSKFKVKSSY